MDIKEKLIHLMNLGELSYKNRNKDKSYLLTREFDEFKHNHLITKIYFCYIDLNYEVISFKQRGFLSLDTYKKLVKDLNYTYGCFYLEDNHYLKIAIIDLDHIKSIKFIESIKND